MEEKERCRSRSPARGASRVQQVVGTIIRRTRESLSRYGTGGLGKDSDPHQEMYIEVKRLYFAFPVIYLETMNCNSMVTHQLESRFGRQINLDSSVD